MPRLVRRRPLAERIKTYLNPYDFFLWFSEQFDSGDWDQWQEGYATSVGVVLNLVFLVARANTASASALLEDDVFLEDDGRHSRWLSWFVRLLGEVALVGLEHEY